MFQINADLCSVNAQTVLSTPGFRVQCLPAERDVVFETGALNLLTCQVNKNLDDSIQSIIM